MKKEQHVDSPADNSPINHDDLYEWERIDRSTYRKNKAIRFGLLSAAVLLTTFTVIGTAGLAFFFVTQFGLTYALPALLTLVGSVIVSSIIFAAYFSIFTVGLWKRTIAVCDENFPVKDRLKKKISPEQTEKESIELEALNIDDFDTETNDAKKSASEEKEKSTALQLIAKITVGVFGILAILFLAGGAYLGVYTVGISTGLTDAFFPLAIMSAVCMFASMTYYFWPDMMNNAKKMASPRKPKTAEQLANKHHFTVKANLVKWAYRLIAIGASIGFAAFKLYSTIHVVKLFGITSPMTIIITGGVAFASMLIMTGITSGVRIWKVGNQLACKIDNIKCKNITAPENTQKQKNPVRYAVSASITFMAAAFNAIASYMGMSTLSGFFCALMPTYALIIGPVFIGLGAFVALTRFVDFWEYYGPAIMVNLKGIVFTPVTETIEFTSASTPKYNKVVTPYYRSEFNSQLKGSLIAEFIDEVSGTYSDPLNTNKRDTLAKAFAQQEFDDPTTPRTVRGY